MTGRSKFISGKLNQTAVYWGNPVSDGAGGRTFADPVEVAVRWEDKFIDLRGREVRSRAVVYLAQDVVAEGYLYLGTLADLSSAEEGDPLSIAAAYEIRGYAKSPDVAGGRFLRQVWL